VTVLAEVSDLEDRLGSGPLTGVDLARAQAVLVDASDVVRDVAGRAEWTATSAPAGAVQIVLAAAQRAYRNPDGLTRQRLGDAEWGFWRGTEPGVYLTKQEMDRLKALAAATFRVVTNVTPFNRDEDDLTS
jgi:hypothetical protein